MSAEEVKKEDDTSSVGYSKFELNHHNFVRIPPVDTFFNLYVTGAEVISKSKVMENIEDSIRFFLEESDVLRTFQIFLDVHSGFGPVNKFIHEVLRDECPKKPVLQYNIENPAKGADIDNKTHQDMKNLNKIFSLQQLIDSTSYTMPIQPDQFKDFKYFEPKYKMTHPDVYQDIFALALSNITFPYRETHNKNHDYSSRSFVDVL